MKKKILLFLLCLTSAYFAERLIGLQTHTLINRDDWISLKHGNSMHRLGLMGTKKYLLERQALAGEELNLSAWFGFNDLVYYKALPEFEEYRVKFRLDDEKSYLWIFLDCGNDYCNAVRLSRFKRYPSGLFKVGYDGKFLERKNLRLLDSGTHEFSLRKEETGYTVSVGEAIKTSVDYNLPEKTIRLMGAQDGSVVSAILVDGNKIDFRAPFNFARFSVLFLIIGLFSIVLSIYSVLAALLAVLVVLALVLLLFFFDRIYWSRRYVVYSKISPVESSSESDRMFEKFRQKFFGAIPDVATTNIVTMPVPLNHYETIRNLPPPDFRQGNYPQQLSGKGEVRFSPDISEAVRKRKSKGTVTLAFFGGSQTWGAGATAGHLTWPSLLVQQMQARTTKTVQGVNFARCGVRLRDYFQWLPQLEELRPDLLIVHLGANDALGNEKEFLTELERLRSFTQKTETRMLLSLEALNVAGNLVGTDKAQLVKQFAKERDIEVVDLNAEFSLPENFDSGLLFMDFVHFSDAGQKLTAHFFANQSTLLKLLR